IQPAGLGDFVFEDTNNNGIQDAGENGVAGVLVKLQNPDGSAVLDGDGNPITTNTAADGSYSFTGLTPGEYKVMFVAPDGFEFTTANVGGNDSIDSDADPSNGMTQTVTLSSGEFNDTLDAGLIQPAGLGDFVFEDTNNNGIQDAGENGVAGVLVKLQNPDGSAVLDGDGNPITTNTAADGSYSFTGLTPGEYKVMFVAPDGFEFTTANVGGNDSIDSDADPSNGMTQTVTLSSGEFNDTLDAGLIQPNPSIDIEKFTNGVDADTPEEAPEIAVGDTVTWTYEVTNTGNVSFDASEIVVTDDQEGIITNIINQGDGDNILASGETWVYQKTGIAQNLTGSGGGTETFNFTGNSGLDGSEGNIRTFSAGDISVKTSAFSRDSYGVFDQAFLGSFSSGLGVTDASEGNGGNGLHRVDNVYRDNYVLFEFSESVVVDRTLLASVGADSDITYWVGTVNDPFNNHNILSDSFLSSLDFSQDNNTNSSSARWADINNGEVAGNVLVIAAATSESHPNDRFKIKKLEIEQVESGIYQNTGTVEADGATDSDLSHYVNLDLQPGIDIEKFTNGVDADTPGAAAVIAAGDTVTWTYEVTNTGNVSFNASDISVTDDMEGAITHIIDKGDGDNILDAGETWVYQETGIAQNLTAPTGETETFHFTGYSGLDGPDGNIRTFSAGDVSVKASAFSRDHYGNFDEAFLGSFSSGLGVTDASEGNGGNGLHRVDNVYNDNYVLFEFSETVVVDEAFLDSVGADSDITVWVGTADDPFHSHNILSDSFLNDLEFMEDNNTHSSNARWADINNGEVAGNILVIAAATSESHPDDRFKIRKLEVEKVESGIYQNVGTVNALGLTDSDLSSYVNPASDIFGANSNGGYA
ncbi:MAG: hypothetical protein F6K58_03135, partial [Symploca sp. SIO2E9]|nr:hypothetical protein [Symploca sp. SIO2E9]